MATLPLHLNVAGVPVLVVGAGPVGGRRRDLLVAAGAVVRWVAPDAGPSGLAVAFHPTHLDGQRLAFACAPPAVNQAVVDAARARNVWVCRADEGDADFRLPARRVVDGLAISLTTGVPAATAALMAHLDAHFVAAASTFAATLGQVRAARPAGPTRQALLRRLARGPLLSMLCRGDEAAARAWLAAALDD